MIKIPKEKDYFKPMRKVATGLVGLGVATAVGAGVAARGPASASVMGGFSTLAGFAPIAVTAVGGKAVLDVLKKKKRR